MCPSRGRASPSARGPGTAPTPIMSPQTGAMQAIVLQAVRLSPSGEKNGTNFPFDVADCPSGTGLSHILITLIIFIP